MKNSFGLFGKIYIFEAEKYFINHSYTDMYLAFRDQNLRGFLITRVLAIFLGV